MPQVSRTDAEIPLAPPSIAQLADLPEVQAANVWLKANESQLCRWQMEMVRIPAPPFGESARSAWLEERFAELGLDAVHTDQVGNVFGAHPGREQRCISLSAHIDTVFAANAEIHVRQEGSKLFGPGISDNGAGVAALLGVAAALRSTSIHPALSILFIGNVGEEGEGDLRGMRHIFSQEKWRDSIAASLIVDGAGTDTIVAEALGSRRFEVSVRGPGGHSWSDFGLPNPIFVLARAIVAFSRTPIAANPKTTFNVGVIRGGTSVNSIPESASMRVDIRSSSPSEIDRLEQALRAAVADALQEDAASDALGKARHDEMVAEIVKIGDRPAGELSSGSRILQIIRAVDAHLGNSAQVQRASTDANVPLSLGREAIAIGAGGRGGGAHTLQEWFDGAGREVGLQRILLTLLALAGVNA